MTQIPTSGQDSMRLADRAPDLERVLNRGTSRPMSTAMFDASRIRRQTTWMIARDGVRLATDIYLPPRTPAPAIAIRTPYGRASELYAAALLAFAQRGWVSISQDCRGTGESEPDRWDYAIFEPEDGWDFVEWVTRQAWFDGLISSFGGSYAAATQWCMSAHPCMSAIAPEVGGLQVTRNTVRRHMFVNAYPRVVGKGSRRGAMSYTEIERAMEAETMASGYFNSPLRSEIPAAVFELNPELRGLTPSDAKRWIWRKYCQLDAQKRAQLMKNVLEVDEFSYTDYWSLPALFDCLIPYGAHTLPSVSGSALCARLRAPALLITGWYDWNLCDTLHSWTTLRAEASTDVASRSRLVITPAAHNVPGYHEGERDHPELRCNYRVDVDLLLSWCSVIRDHAVADWPVVTYYLMGANEWRVASDWPVPEAALTQLFLRANGALSCEPTDSSSAPDSYVYDPDQPTPTMGGSVLSFLYPSGSVDVSEVQKRSDVLTYTTPPLVRDLDIIGPLRLVLYASSSATDTDFSGRLSDVFPDGRALQLQSGTLRARYRNEVGDPELLEPGRVYRLEIDMWATANRFKAGHRLRLDISSADFPRFDRNANCGGAPGGPVPARQHIYHDVAHPSHLRLYVIGEPPLFR
jgi:predicted acyl esterase